VELLTSPAPNDLREEDATTSPTSPARDAPRTDVPAAIETWTGTTVVLPRVSVIVPALNEAENLPHVLPFIPDVHEVILVDGWSTDGTVEVARALRPDIRIVAQERPGKGAALCTGFEAATGDIIVTIDADGSTDPREIPAFVDALKSGADFVKGSRFLSGGGTSDMPLYRQFGNFGFVMMVRVLYGGRYTDLCYGYNSFWKRVLPDLALDGDGFEIETMMNIRALRVGLRVAEVPSFESKRVYGEGRLRTIPDGMRVLRTILSERLPRRRRGIRIAPAADPEVVPERLSLD
jgi:glycosyltransferase involved in cell wall biosynthesis